MQDNSVIRLTVIFSIIIGIAVMVLAFFFGMYYYRKNTISDTDLNVDPSTTGTIENKNAEFVLRQSQLPDGIANFPRYRLILQLPSEVNTELNSIETALKIDNADFSLVIESTPGDTGGTFETLPSVVSLENLRIPGPVYRINIQNQSNQYYYSHEYSTDQDVCEGYSFDDSFAACGTPWLKFTSEDNSEVGYLLVGCTANGEKVRYCDEIVENMRVELITE